MLFYLFAQRCLQSRPIVGIGSIVGRRVRESDKDTTVLALGLEFEWFKAIHRRKLFEACLEVIEERFLT